MSAFTNRTNSFFSRNKQADSQEVEFKMSEVMLLKDLPPAKSKLFTDVDKLIKENEKYMDKQQLLDIKNKERELSDVMDRIKTDCLNGLFFSITSLSHQIDNGRKMLKEFQRDLDESRNDENNVKSIKTFPSPFLVRYSKQLEENSESISEEIEAYRSHLQSLSNNSNDLQNNHNNKKNDALFDFFNEEHEAILRTSSNISQLIKKLSLTRILLCQKLKIDQSQLTAEIEDVHDSVFASVQTKYNQFRENQKSKLLKFLDNSDLFGMPIKIEESNFTTTKKFTGSGGFGQNRLQKGNDIVPTKIDTTKSNKIAVNTPPPPNGTERSPFA